MALDGDAAGRPGAGSCAATKLLRLRVCPLAHAVTTIVTTVSAVGDVTER